MSKYPSYCCQKCGDHIGWLGRFLLPFLHCSDCGAGRSNIDGGGLVSVKVDGKENLVTVADLVRCYQKNAAADNRLRDATEAMKAAKQELARLITERSAILIHHKERTHEDAKEDAKKDAAQAHAEEGLLIHRTLARTDKAELRRDELK